jgi:hypothetical protein
MPTLCYHGPAHSSPVASHGYLYVRSPVRLYASCGVSDTVSFLATSCRTLRNDAIIPARTEERQSLYNITNTVATQ